MRHSEDFACQRLHSTAMTYKIVLIGLFIVISTIQTRIVEKGWDYLHPWIERGCLSLRRAVYPFGGHARRRAMSDARSRTCTTITFMWSTFPSWKSKSCGRNAARINRWWVRSRKLIAKLKAEIDSLKQEISDYKSVHSKLRAAELERENTELRGKVRSYEDVIQRNNLWRFFHPL